MNAKQIRFVTESIVGPVDWKSDYSGLCECPGRESHKTESRESDCRIYINGTPVLHCFHASCLQRRKEVVELLRRKLPKLKGASNYQSQWQTVSRKAESLSFDPTLLAKVASRVPADISRQWLLEQSPIPVRDLAPHEALTHLYLPGEKALVFVGTQRSQGFLWKHGAPLARIIAHPNGVWFQNQPVDGKYYPRVDGTPSRRGARSVTSWRFMVIESDVAEESQWLRLLVQLPLPVSAIYTSGGKSIHALVHLAAKSQEDWKAKASKWKPHLTRLGADPQSLTSLRNTRLPQAFRGERQQQLLFLNPNPTEQPIYFPIAQ